MVRKKTRKSANLKIKMKRIREMMRKIDLRDQALPIADHLPQVVTEGEKRKRDPTVRRAERAKTAEIKEERERSIRSLVIEGEEALLQNQDHLP